MSTRVSVQPPPSVVPRSPMSPISPTPLMTGPTPRIQFPTFTVTMPMPPYGLLYSNTLTPVGFTNPLLDGEIVIGSSTGLPIATTITAGTGIIITNGPNSITIASTASSLTWSQVTSVVPLNPIQIVLGNGYICNGAFLVTFTLPLAPAAGDTFIIISNTSRFQIQANGGQQICIGITASTPGTGTCTSNSTGDNVQFVYLGANIFRGFAPQGSLTLT